MKDATKELRGPKEPLETEPIVSSARTEDAPEDFYRWFSTALEEARVADHTWHCNRPTFASRLVMAGVDLCVVAELPGHGTLQM
jgi:site-specific recombinase XerD